MNAPFNHDHSAAVGDSLPMPRATLEMLERQRDRALASLLDGFDGLAAGIAAASENAVSFARDDAFSGRKTNPAGLSDNAIKALLGGNGARDSYDKRDGHETWREVFQEETRRTIDRAVWTYVIEATDLEKLMDREARDEFRQSLADDPPAPTVENIRATLSHYCAEAPAILKRGIANAFSKLDRRFRSHDGFKIGARVILDRYFSEYGSMSGRAEETLRDIERAFAVLDGKEQPAGYAGIVGQLRGIRSSQRPCLVESDWVRVRIFKNGNAHLWFTRDDLVKRVNRLLADYYGETIGEGSDVADVSDMGPGYHLTPARNLGYFPTPEAVAAKLFGRADLSYHVGNGKIARVLEPSAGDGALADKVRAMGARVHCVEIDTGRAAVLRGKGHGVTEGDFLRLQPHQVAGGLFDCVVMNPPFDRGRDCDHVRHALQFLKPGGLLLAVMSASAELGEDSRRASFRAALTKEGKGVGWREEFFADLPDGSFADAGTMVNTVTLALFKKS